jgi:lipopolysaccharide transport system permease protein
MTTVVGVSVARGIGNVLLQLVSPARFAIAIRDSIALMWRDRSLCGELVKRELTVQYAGQVLGTFWVIGHPAALLLIYIFVFVFVLKVRISQGIDLPRDYTNYILAGLVPWLAIAQLLGRSCTALIGQANLVKQVIFPIEVIPVGGAIVSLVPLAVGSVAIVLYQLASAQPPSWILVLAPAFLLQLFAFLCGIAFFLSAITPFFRDVKDFVTVFVTAGVYLIPAFYLPSWVPALFVPVLYVNPFSYPIWVFQDIFYFGRIEHRFAWAIFFVLSLVSLSFGFRLFKRLKPYVANAL